MLRLTLLLGDPWTGQTRLTPGFWMRSGAAVILVFVFVRLFDRYMRSLQPPGRGGGPGRGEPK